MAEHATVKMGESGRLTIPKPVRDALGVAGQEAIVSISIEVRDDG